jgi:hypothetical protein
MKNTFSLTLALFFICFGFIHPGYSQDAPAVGYTQSMAVDPSESNIVYSATLGQGLLKSTDHGDSWTLICSQADKNEFHVIKVVPHHPSRLLAGGLKSGVLLSTDKGSTWKQIGLPNVSICDIAIDETNPSRVFVLASEGVYSNEDIDSKEWKLSFDHVKFVAEFTHTQIPTVNKNDASRRTARGINSWWGYSRFQKIAISPHAPNTIMVGARWEGGYHRSDDGGATWRHETLSGMYRRVDVIFFHPKDRNIMYVGTHHQGLFKTYNNGYSWVPQSDGLRPQTRLPYYGAYLISGFTIDTTNPDIFYSGSDFSNWKSTDGGGSWQELDRSLTCEFVRTMAVDPQHPNTVYAGSNVGMYRSDDAGKHWRSINIGLRKAEIIKTLSVPTSEGTFHYALSEHYPFVFRKSGGERWKSFSWLLAEYGATIGRDLYFDDASKHLVFVSDSGNFTSDDYGYRWRGKNSEIHFANVKSEVRELPLSHAPDLKHNYVFAVELTGDVFFNDALVDSLYRKPPYISLQIVEDGYPWNGTVPAWRINIDDHVKATVEVDRSLIDPSRTYLLYAEVRDFQKNYKTASATLHFVDNAIVPVSMELHEGVCLQHRK